MKDQTCGYCTRNQELLDGFGIYVCDLEASVLVLFKEQSHPGRCIVACKEHASEMVDLTDAERNAFFADVNRVAKALHAAFHPDKINYGAYGDTSGHMHFHLVPNGVGLHLRHEPGEGLPHPAGVRRDHRQNQGEPVSGTSAGRICVRRLVLFLRPPSPCSGPDCG